MEDTGKTNEHLNSELGVLRQLVSELEALGVERQQTDQALRESENRFRELFEHMTSGVAVYEAKHNGNKFIIKDFNKAAEQITGLKKNQVLGRDAVETPLNSLPEIPAVDNVHVEVAARIGIASDYGTRGDDAPCIVLGIYPSHDSLEGAREGLVQVGPSVLLAVHLIPLNPSSPRGSVLPQ